MVRIWAFILRISETWDERVFLRLRRPYSGFLALTSSVLGVFLRHDFDDLSHSGIFRDPLDLKHDTEGLSARLDTVKGAEILIGEVKFLVRKTRPPWPQTCWLVALCHFDSCGFRFAGRTSKPSYRIGRQPDWCSIGHLLFHPSLAGRAGMDPIQGDSRHHKVLNAWHPYFVLHQ